MPKEVLFVGPRQVEISEYSDPPLGPRDVKVENLYSGISHGTERSHFRGEAVWHGRSVETDGFVTEGRSMHHPFTYGYEDVARVVEVGAEVSELAVGDIVMGSAHHRETRNFDLDRAKVGATTRGVGVSVFPYALPPDDDLEKYVFVSLGTVALDAILVGPVRLGESAVVVGQGVVGLLTMQLCKLSGADPVIAVDLLDERLETAKRLGADYVLNPNHGDVGREVKRILGGPGADVCFECSGKAGGIGLALHCGTPFPKVVAVGMYDGPADDLYLGEEFCRSAGQILHSRSGGYRLPPEDPGGGLYHRRWDIIRVHNVIIKLLHTGRLDVSGLITHRFPLEKAPQAYKLIDEGAQGMMKVIFDLTAG